MDSNTAYINPEGNPQLEAFLDSLQEGEEFGPLIIDRATKGSKDGPVHSVNIRQLSMKLSAMQRKTPEPEPEMATLEVGDDDTISALFD